MLSRQVRLIRLFRCIKQAQPNSFVVKFDLCYPFAILLANAHVATFTACLMAVLRVLGNSRFAKITQTVVRSVSVNVIYLICRPDTMYVQPRQAMRQVQNVVQSNGAVAVLHVGPSQRALPTLAARYAPRKQSRVWVVVDQLSKAVLRKFWRVHNSHNIMLIKGCQA